MRFLFLLLTLSSFSAAYAADSCEKALTPAVGSDLHLPDVPQLDFYEAYRTLHLDPVKRFDDFQPQTGITLKRDAAGNVLRNPDGSPAEATLRVLTDNPNESVSVVGDFNKWGQGLTSEQMKAYELHPVPGTRYHEGVVPGLKQGQSYRLLVNGKQVLDPASREYTNSGPLNSVFWDFDRPGAYKMRYDAPDLRRKHVTIGEVELHSLVAKFPHPGGGEVPAEKTFAFIGDPSTGFAQKFKDTFQYDAIHVLPVNQSVSGLAWQKRYQVFGNFAVDSKFGTPDDFARAVDALNSKGIGVIVDFLGSHVPYKDELSDIGLTAWTKEDGRSLFTTVDTEWGTKRYDYENPFVRRFLVDGALDMMKRYRLAGLRIDNVGGIMARPGGPDFLKQLVGEIRQYKPDAYIESEDFFGNDRTESLALGGLGANGRNGSTYFGFIRQFAQKGADQLDMQALHDDVRELWGWNEEAQIPYITNHDEASQGSGGATGKYFVSLVDGGGDFHSYGKAGVFNNTAMVMLGASEDTPQLRLLQRGDFSNNPDVDWQRLNDPAVANSAKFSAELSRYINEHRAFAFENLHPDIENHTDYNNKLMSYLRIDRETGKRIYILVNYSPNEFRNYQFGVDVDASLSLKLDSDSKDFGGSNQLENAVPQGTLPVSPNGMHGKSHSVTVPYVGPYARIILEK